MLVCLLSGWACPGSVPAGEVRRQISSQEVYVGEPVRVDIIISDAESYEPPAFPEVEGATVSELGGVSKRSHVSIINGRMTQQVSLTWSFAVTPTRAGTIKVPQMSVRVDGEVQILPSFAVVVSQSETGDLTFLEVAADRDAVYIGESLRVVLRLWIRPYRDRRLGIELNEASMWNCVQLRNSQWGVFTEPLQELLNGGRRPAGRQVVRKDSAGDSRAYYLYEIEATLWPQRAGTLDPSQLGDVTVRIDYPTRLERDRSFFSSIFEGDLRITASRAVVAAAQPEPVEIKPIPIEGRPPGYNGAVGRYTFAVAAKPQEVRVGDPITLTLTLSGEGNLDLLQPPKLEEVTPLVESFKIPDDVLAGTVEGKVKRFTQTLRARNDAVEAIPAIPFTYFDTRSEKFVTLYSDPIPVEVTASDRPALTSIVQSEDGPRVSTQLTRRQEGILGNYTDMDGLLVSQAFAPGAATVAWIASPPVVLLLTTLVRRRRERLRSDVAYASRRNARSTALRTLSRAESARHGGGDPREEAAIVLAALTQYVAHRYGLPFSSLTRAEAMDRLRRSGVPQEKTRRVDELLGRCESVQYAGSLAGAGDALCAQARRCIRDLERERF